jgi:hypothetical protein
MGLVPLKIIAGIEAVHLYAFAHPGSPLDDTL